MSPQKIGVRVASNDGRHGVLSLGHIVSQSETRTTILPMAVDESGQALPAWERQADRLFNQPATSAAERP
jgi:hypothetical protein